jgi:uncharacterized membrane protein
MDETTPPPPPTPEPIPVEVAPAAPVAEGSGLTPNLAATICAVVPLLGGIIFLLLEKKNAFVRFWAMQSVLFGGALFIVFIVLTVVSVVFALLNIPVISWLVGKVTGLAAVVFWVGFLVLWVITIIKAFSNKEWEIPYLGKLARKQLGGEQLI